MTPPPPPPSAAAIPILVGTRDAAFAPALRAALPGGPWSVAAANSPRAFRAALRKGPPPSFAAVDADSFGRAAAADLCRELRRAEADAGAEPAVVETWTRSVTPDAVREALGAGADDCREPVAPDALALLLSARAAGDAAAAGGNDEVRIDAAAGRATLGGRDLPLTASCFAALRVLASHGGRPVSREALLREMRGRDAGSVLPRSVDSLVSELRARLGPAGWRIATAWGRGYRWLDGPRPSAAGAARLGRRRLPVRLGATLSLLLLLGLAAAALLRDPATPTAPPLVTRHSSLVTPPPAVAAADTPASPLSTSPSPPVTRHSSLVTPPSPDPVVQRLRERFREEAAGSPGVDVAAPPAFGPLDSSVPNWFS